MSEDASRRLERNARDDGHVVIDPVWKEERLGASQ